MAAALPQDAAEPSALRINRLHSLHSDDTSEVGSQDTQQRCSEWHLFVRPKINLNGNNFFLKGKTV